MKKITLFAIAFIAISFASCKKDYTCTCTNTSNGGSSTSITKIIGVSKKAATAHCVSGTTTSTSGGFSSTKVNSCTLSK